MLGMVDNWVKVVELLCIWVIWVFLLCIELVSVVGVLVWWKRMMLGLEGGF